jgi:hypothetical protein
MLPPVVDTPIGARPTIAARERACELTRGHVTTGTRPTSASEENE